MSNKSKKLTLSALNKEAAALNEKKKVYVMDGKYECDIAKNFLDTEVQKVTFEYIQLVTELSQRKEVKAETLLSVEKLLYGLICKYFTNLPVKMNSIDEIVAITNNLLNTGIIAQLFSGDPNQGFLESEVKKVQDAINKASKGLGQAIGEMAIREAMNEDIEDADEDSFGDEENGE